MRVQYGRAAFDSVVVGRQPIAARLRPYTFWSSEVPPFALRVSFFWSRIRREHLAALPHADGPVRCFLPGHYVQAQRSARDRWPRRD